jgi:O-antigen/teichoic acid export membrane protein
VTDSDEKSDFYARALRRGALFNLLGVVAKLVQPIYILSITWLWGPRVMGQYLLAQSLLEIVFGGITAGYTDATTIFGSRHADRAATDPEERRALYRVFANTFGVTTVLALFVGIGALLAAEPVVDNLFPRYQELLPGLYLLAWSLVPRAVGQVAIAATKATLHMEHDAFVNGLVQPLCMLAGCLATYELGGGLTALLGVQLLVDCIVCVLSLSACSRYFSLMEIWAALRAFHFDGALLGFSIPQSLNLTFNRYIARLDGIMLAAFGLGPAELGYFGTAALLTTNIAQIRLVFSAALGPVVARHHRAGDKRASAAALAQVAGWTTSLAVPAVLASVVLRKDVLHVVSHSYGDHSLFVAILLIPPFTNCAYGMAGACLMFTGHTRVTLANSFCVALLNTLLTYLLIPRYGMVGAAAATAVATTVTSGLQMIELRRLEGISIPWKAVWRPHLGLALGLVVVALVWDPVTLPAIGRFATAAGLLVGYGILMLLLGHEELVGLVRRRAA